MNDKEKLQKWFNDIVSERTTDTGPLMFGRVMPFGKHKGEHVYWLLVTYPNYMNWITNNTSYRLSEVEEWWRATLDEQHGAKATLTFDQWLDCMGHEKEEIPEEPNERWLYRMKCKHYGMEGICLKHSGYLNKTTHITLQCDGDCRRMKNYDKKKGNIK